MIQKTLGSMLCLALVAQAADDPAPKPNPVEGKWKRIVETNNGPVTFVKEHEAGKTTLEAFNADGTLIGAKSSNYRLSENESVRLFTFFNNAVTAGPDAGRKLPGETSYIYRIEGDKFYEVRGMLKGTEEPFDVLIWERVEEESSGPV